MKSVLAGDLGGTKCRFAVVTEDYRVLCAQRLTTTRDRGEFLQAMDSALTRALQQLPSAVEPPLAVGLGVAGILPAGSGRLAGAPNLPLDGFALDAHLERRFELPTTVLNDGRASAIGEYLRGDARGSDPLLCLFFGTGIGIGLVVGGQPYVGADNIAGEIGHTVYTVGGRQCPCGQRGHFEAYCGGRSITERAQAELGPAPRGSSWTVDDVVACGSAAARGILDEAASAASTLVANCCTLLNPRAVVLGGGVLAGWPQLRQRIEEFVGRQCSAQVTGSLRFCRSVGGSDAILLGAARATGAFGR